MIVSIARGGLIGIGVLAMALAVDAHGQRNLPGVPDFRVADEPSVPSGGIAGFEYSENFESGYSYGCQPVGLGCTLEVIDHPDQSFGRYSMLIRALGSGNEVQDFRSPILPLQTGGTYADIIINNSTSVFQFSALNNSTTFYNTRVNFEGDGTIRALQIFGNPPCSVAQMALTTGTWTPGVKMRIGIEVAAGGADTLRIYKDGVQIFAGHDISQYCNAGNPAIGIGQVRVLNSNAGTTASLVIDNLSPEAIPNACNDALPSCAADLFPAGGDGLVNLDDLLGVINTWGQNGLPLGPRPAGDCSPGATGDCQVNLDDILAVINSWGACPATTGACCVQGACVVRTQAACTSAPDFGSYQGDFVACAQVTCPTTPANDTCGNAYLAAVGVNNWNNANASNDGPSGSMGCFPNGGMMRADVWFRFTAPTDGQYTFSTLGTLPPFTDTALMIFGSWTCGPWGTVVGCNDNINFAEGNLLSQATVALIQGQQVLVRCGSKANQPVTNSGPAVLNITASGGP